MNYSKIIPCSTRKQKVPLYIYDSTPPSPPPYPPMSAICYYLNELITHYSFPIRLIFPIVGKFLCSNGMAEKCLNF